MNDKIDNLFNEIVNLRLKEAKGTHLVPLTIDLYKNRLIDIIVKDCIRIITNNGIATADHDQMVRQDCVNDIKKHFGVE